MSYVRDNGLARARRRRERRSLAILVACALLVLGSIVFAATFMSRSDKDAKGPCPTGTASTVVPPEGSFVLNVYNSGGAKGAAGSAAEALRSHQFQVGVVGNDPYQKSISDAGEIRFGPEGAADAKKYVAKYAAGAKLVEDGRDGTSVDLVVGPEFQTIDTASSTPSTTVVCK